MKTFISRSVVAVAAVVSASLLAVPAQAQCNRYGTCYNWNGGWNQYNNGYNQGLTNGLIGGGIGGLVLGLGLGKMAAERDIYRQQAMQNQRYYNNGYNPGPQVMPQTIVIMQQPQNGSVPNVPVVITPQQGRGPNPSMASTAEYMDGETGMVCRNVPVTINTANRGSFQATDKFCQMPSGRWEKVNN